MIYVKCASPGRRTSEYIAHGVCELDGGWMNTIRVIEDPMYFRHDEKGEWATSTMGAITVCVDHIVEVLEVTTVKPPEKRAELPEGWYFCRV